MRLPKPENWTKRTSERVIARVQKLEFQYERLSEVDENGNELNSKAKELDLEIMILKDAVPVEDRPKFW